MTNAEAWFNIALRPRKQEGQLRTAASTLTQLLNYDGEEKCLEFAFEGRESSRVPGAVLGGIVPKENVLLSVRRSHEKMFQIVGTDYNHSPLTNTRTRYPFKSVLERGKKE